MKRYFRLTAMMLSLVFLLGATTPMYATTYNDADEHEEGARISYDELVRRLNETEDADTVRAILEDEALVHWMLSEEYWDDDDTPQAAQTSNVTYPLPGYGTNKFYNDDTYVGCECHGKPNCTYLVDTCDCKLYQGSIQCLAFARFVFFQTFGEHCDNTNSYKRMDFSSVADAKAYVEGLPIGSHIRTGEDKHSIIIAARSNNDVSIYHANTANNCNIAYETISWASFYSRYSIAYKSWATSHTHTPNPLIGWTIVGTATVCRTISYNCILCSEYINLTDYAHTYPYSPVVSCVKCGYTP